MTCKKNCNKCNQGFLPNCGCESPCNSPVSCGCKISTGAECITMNKDLECASITKGKKLEDVLIELDSYLCEIVGLIQGVSSFVIANVGEQVEVYKGISGTGIRQFRTLESLSESLTITQEQDKITFDFDGSGLETCITSDTLGVTEEEGCINLEVVAVQEVEDSCQDGVSVVDSYENNILTLRGITSNTMQVEEKEGCIVIDFPPPALQDSVPRYIVNNLYTGDEELGTTARPFKTIAAAITQFVGNGTIDAPQNQGAFIIVQRGNSYTHNGNFSYRNLNVVLEEGAVVNCNPGTGNFAVDYDALNNTTATFSLELRAGALFNCTQKGFRNQGSTGGAAAAKRIVITGSPTAEVRLSGAFSAGYVMFDINSANALGYNMPATANITVSDVRIFSLLKDMWAVGRDGALSITGATLRHANISDVINPTQKTFYQSGGAVTLTDNTYSINGTTREGAFYLNKNVAYGCTLRILGGRILFSQQIDVLFVNESATEDATLECKNLVSVGTPITEVFESPKLWRGIDFDANILSGRIDHTKADLTKNNVKSVSNWIGGYNIDTLVSYVDRAAAIAANLPKGAKFINRGNSANVADWYIDMIM